MFTDYIQSVGVLGMQKFNPLIIRNCDEITKALGQLHELYALDSYSLNFDILEIKTFNPDTQEEITTYDTNDNLRQKFDISVRDRTESEHKIFLELALDRYNTKLTLTFKKGMTLSLDETFLETLYNELLRNFATQKIFIDTTESNNFKTGIIENLKNAIQRIIENPTQSRVLEKNESFEILRSSYIPRLESKTYFHPKILWEQQNQTNIEFASYAVVRDELVLEVLAPCSGESGRDLLGDYHEVNIKQDNKQLAEIVFDEKIFRKEQINDGVGFYALTTGYVSFNDNKLSMLDSQNLTEINIRTTGHLLGGKEKATYVNITCSNPQDDAVGQGIILEAGNVDIVGCIGEKAKILANNIKIHGQTHQRSYIQAHTCEIDFHKGSVQSEELKIQQCELGNIDAGNVKIDEVSGGNIHAKNITINKLHSNTKLYVSQTLDIALLDGGGNEIYISPSAYFEDRKKIDEDTQFMQECVEKINRLIESLNKDNTKIKQAKPIIKQLRSIIEKNNQLNQPIDKRMTKAVAEYIMLVRHANFLKHRILQIQESAKTCNRELKNIDENLKNATINCHSKWNNHNEIFYDYLFPKGRDMMSLENEEECSIGIDKNTLKLTKF